MKGDWKFNSGTLNHWQVSRYTMDVEEQKFVKVRPAFCSL
jgi:hypothetical protein